MALVAISEIFSAGALSTWMFSIENGQGCYIPAYQRPYSWDKDNAARLFEDAANGIEQMLQRASTISFLGTIIAIHDIKHTTVKPLLKQEVPQKVMTIIDGQQRLCTMMMISIAFHDHIRRLSKPFDGKADEHFKWIAEDCVLRIADLEKAILLDMNAGEENQRYYPRIIRAMDDQWSRRKTHAAYTSRQGLKLARTDSNRRSGYLGLLGNFESVRESWSLRRHDLARLLLTHRRTKGHMR